jgi:hypothetical protein
MDTWYLDGTRIQFLDQKEHIPILIEVPPDSRVEKVNHLITLLLASKQENLVFLVETPVGPRGLPLPLELDTTGFALTVRGRHQSYADRADRIWIEVETIGLEGTCVVMKIQAEEDYQETPLVNIDEVEHPELSRPVPPHPPLGAWSVEDLQRYLSQPEVRSTEPIVVLRATGEDRMNDFLRCLSELTMAVGPDLVVYIPPDDY